MRHFSPKEKIPQKVILTNLKQDSLLESSPLTKQH